MTPHGWRNLAPERHRIRGRESVLNEIQKIHHAAFETQVGDDFAYWVGSEDNPRLVGIAWKADETNTSWCFACMNEIALEIGVVCTLVHDRVLRRSRVIPGSLAGVCGVVYENSKVVKARKTKPAPINQVPVASIDRLPFRERGAWWVLVETQTHVRQLGPFSSPRAARAAAT